MKTGSQSVFNIIDYKATGQGTINDSPAIQHAIDDCHAAGGGMVCCPPGSYRIGTLYLRSKVNLHVERGAILMGSPLRADYTARYNPPYDQGALVEKAWPEHLICAWREHDIAITGAGIIDGNSDSLLGKEMGTDGGYYDGKDYFPDAICCRHVDGLSLHDVNVKWDGAVGPWQEGLRLESVTGADVRGVQAEPYKH